MERLTERLENGVINVKYASQHETAIHRLVTIEDILGDEYDLDDLKTAMWCKETVGMAFSEDTAPVERLRELWFADKDGRCVVLPCKDWLDIVFGDQEVFYGIDEEYIENPIRQISVDSSARCTWYDGWKTVVLKGYDENGLDWEFSPEEIGKTVFLTREAAEEALKAREQE